MSSEVRLLDSSVIIRHFRYGGEVSARLASFAGLFVPSIALGELISGAVRSLRPERNLAQIEQFLEGVTVLVVDEETARYYGRINALLAVAGTPIPQNDVWIAACAMQQGMMLATSDEYFGRIAGLNVEKW